MANINALYGVEGSAMEVMAKKVGLVLVLVPTFCCIRLVMTNMDALHGAEGF